MKSVWDKRCTKHLKLFCNHRKKEDCFLQSKADKEFKCYTVRLYNNVTFPTFNTQKGQTEGNWMMQGHIRRVISTHIRSYMIKVGQELHRTCK